MMTAVFVVRFLVRYLRTRTWSAEDGERIMNAAAEGNRYARAVDWLMRQISITWNWSRAWVVADRTAQAGEGAAALEALDAELRSFWALYEDAEEADEEE